MKYLGVIFFAFLFFVCATVFGADPVAVSSAVTDALAKADAAIPSDVPSFVIILLGFLASSEILMRVIPTAKPKSWFLLASLFLGLVSSICAKSSALLDKLAQNVKDPQAK